jgi:hypothetical protein
MALFSHSLINPANASGATDNSLLALIVVPAKNLRKLK